MNSFHKCVKNESSSDSEEGEVVDSDEEVVESQSNGQMVSTKPLYVSKSLQILDTRGVKRKNRFSIWSDILLEEELNESMSSSMDIKKRKLNSRKMDRNSENYSFWTKRQLEDNSDKSLAQHSDTSGSKRRQKKIKRKKNEMKVEPKVDFVTQIGLKLNEPKVDLLRKVCQTIGEKKTSELCSATLDIESAGGLKTLDGKRRRTSGGVFFHLLKNDSNITKEDMDLIFSEDVKQFKNKRKIRKREKRKLFKKKTNPKTIDVNISEIMATNVEQNVCDSLPIEDID